MHAQLCLTLSDSVDCGPPGSSVHGILQARKLEWVSISFSRRSPQSGIKLVSPESPALQMDCLPLEPLWNPWVTWVALNPMTTVLTRDRREDRREEGHVRREAETGAV